MAGLLMLAFHNQFAGEGGNMADAGLQQLAPM